jgi:hypothetical protein
MLFKFNLYFFPSFAPKNVQDPRGLCKFTDNAIFLQRKSDRR